MANKKHRFLSPPGECITIFCGGGLLLAHERGDMMTLAPSASCGEEEDEDLFFSDEEDDEFMEAMHRPPLAKR